jgi:hypothetical protein
VLDGSVLDCVAPAWATPAFAGLGAGSTGHPIVKGAIAQSRVRVPRIGSITIALTSGGVNTTPPRARRGQGSPLVALDVSAGMW